MLIDIFFLILGLGCSATTRPLAFNDIGNFDLLVLTAACLLFWVFGWFFKERTITRIEGGLLTLCYIAYVTLLIIAA